ncbi:hypothetical protein [Acuticoccus sediminis]|uniref:hypothetical protein n=1 Tax=Acuticoccus sediminis TaxID=2184697 RepID=UPI001CFD8DA5|nr:hypothetical protein [Acuticoccus sediminis]
MLHRPHPPGAARDRHCAPAGTVAQDMADGLGLVAAPAFAALALLTAAFDAPGALCGPGQSASPIGGMVTMYLAMSAVHLAPWLRLASARSGPRRA